MIGKKQNNLLLTYEEDTTNHNNKNKKKEKVNINEASVNDTTDNLEDTFLFECFKRIK